MWYFIWVIGVLLACSFGLITTLWIESKEDSDKITKE